MSRGKIILIVVGVAIAGLMLYSISGTFGGGDSGDEPTVSTSAAPDASASPSVSEEPLISPTGPPVIEGVTPEQAGESAAADTNWTVNVPPGQLFLMPLPAALYDDPTLKVTVTLDDPTLAKAEPDAPFGEGTLLATPIGEGAFYQQTWRAADKEGRTTATIESPVGTQTVTIVVSKDA